MEGQATLLPMDDRSAWDAALKRIPHAFAHTWTSCRAFAAPDTTTLLFVWQGQRDVVCPVVERRFGGYVDVVTPYGFSGFTSTGEDNGVAQAWNDVAEDRGWVSAYVQLNPLFELPFTPDGADIVVEKDVFVFSLSGDEETLFQRLPKSRRREVRRWLESDGGFVDDLDLLVDFCSHQIADFMSARGDTGRIPVPDAATWRSLLTSPDVIAFGAQVDGELLAVNVSGLTRWVADDIYLISRPGGERLSMACQWESIRRARARGVGHLSIGGGLRPGDGVESWKRRAGADAYPLRALRQVFRPDVYQQLCARTGQDPRSEGFFPAYRRMGG